MSKHALFLLLAPALTGCLGPSGGDGGAASRRSAAPPIAAAMPHPSAPGTAPMPTIAAGVPRGDDPATWPWLTRHPNPSCDLSEAGNAVYEAATRAAFDRDLVPGELVLTARNMAGPSFLKSADRFAALATLIAGAQHEVDLQWHELDVDSDAFDEVLGGLDRLYRRLQAAPVPAAPFVVRIVSPDWALRPGNDVEVIGAAVRGRLGAIDPRRLVLEVAAHRYLALATMHVKIGIVDGTYVHIGGGNLSNKQNYRLDPTPERDSASIVKGMVAQSALAQFDQLWAMSETRIERCEVAPCVAPAAGAPRGVHPPEVKSPDWAAVGIPADACLPMIFMAKRASEDPLRSEVDQPVGAGISAAFRHAHVELKLSSPNLNAEWRAPILDAVAAGVHVELLLPDGYNDLLERAPALGGGGNRSTMAWMIDQAGAANVGADDGRPLDPRWFSLDGVTMQTGGGATGGRHVKFYAVDSRLVIVGSTNLDKQSMDRSREVALAVDDEAVARWWTTTLFDGDFGRGIPMGGIELDGSVLNADDLAEQYSADQAMAYLDRLE